jgi:hypothetical protein
MKLCSKCKTFKPETHFVMDETRGRLKAWCKSCCAEKNREWRKSKPNYEKDRYQKTKIETRERHLIRKYGVSLSDYELMLRSQGGVCAICGTTEDTQHNGVFHVDHCHSTGAVRGLLCRGCNHVLGHLKDDKSKLVAAIDYLDGKFPQVVEVIGRALKAHMEARQ